MTHENDYHLTEIELPRGFDTVRREVLDLLKSAGLSVFAEIDHAAAATEVGLSLPPTLVIIYGNPRAGTPVMELAPNAALDLPLRVLLRSVSASQTIVAFHPIAAILEKAGAPSEIAGRIAGGQSLLVDRLAQGNPD